MKKIILTFCVLALACGDDVSDPDASVVDASADATIQDVGPDAVRLPDMSVPDTSLPDTGADAFDMGTDVFDAGPPPSCTEEGATRPAVCGNCGEGQELCQSGVWVLQDLCINQGECVAGASERAGTPMCGAQARICNAMCGWGDWGVTTPDGECVRGEERRVTDRCTGDDIATDSCTEACVWDTTAACESPCGTFDTDGFDEEICIPAGPFIRGWEGGGSGSSLLQGPETEVMMSTYVIDRYPVTNGRYRACIAAGACSSITRSEEQAHVDDPAAANAAVHAANWAQAGEFCAWAGRRLPSEAMLVKAARGPAPNVGRFPWPGEEYNCDLSPNPCAHQALAIDTVGENPNERGFYGIEDAIGNGLFWASDWWAFPLPSLPETDPEGPGTGTSHSLISETNHVGFIFRSSGPSEGRPYTIFRCGRNIIEGAE